MKKSLLFALTVAFAVSLTGFHPPAAHGFANSAPNFDCLSCHPGALKTDLAGITGLPASYSPGKRYNLTLTLESGQQSMGNQQGGFAVQASAGKLIVKDGVHTQISNGILTHTLAGSTLRTWTFTWQAPGEPGRFWRKSESGPDVNITVMAVAANGDFSSMGDEVGATGVTIKSSK